MLSKSSLFNMGRWRAGPARKAQKGDKIQAPSVVARRFIVHQRTEKGRGKMQSSVRNFLIAGRRSADLLDGIRRFSTSSNPDSLRNSVASILDVLNLKRGVTLVQNCGDSEIGKIVIQLAKERQVQTISIIDDKPGSPDTIEALKALGGDIVVPESYTKTWYMKRLAGELSPSVGLSFTDGYQATAVAKAVISGGTFVTHLKKLPTHVAYEGAARKPVEWSNFLLEKNVKWLNL